MQIDQVADKFYRELGDLLWIYVYGGNNPSEWVHTSEPLIGALLVRFGKAFKSVDGMPSN